jgi:murein DD-endopeptidase MepM/ murein hydrolase activator NlpD
VKPKKTFSNWLTEPYLLIIRNEENFAEKRFLGFTYAKFFLISFIGFILIMLMSLFLTETILEQWFDPRHAHTQNKKQLVQLTMELDSLAEEVRKKDQFITLFRGFLTGDTDSTSLDTYRQGVNIDRNLNIDLATTSLDSQFRQEFEIDEQVDQIRLSGNSDLLEVFLFSPITGLISRKYNLKENHFGVDVVSKRNEPVMSVASGTVILSSWTQDSGYVIAIQHNSDLISIYKHNAELLKKTSNFVNGGEVIAIIGNTGELTDGPHLHFELWYKGNTVDPEDFVTF